MASSLPSKGWRYNVGLLVTDSYNHADLFNDMSIAESLFLDTVPAVTAAPEPATFGVFGVALAGLGFAAASR